MADPIQLVTKKPNPDAIKILEEALEGAKKGDVVRVGVISQLADGNWSTSYSSTDDARVDAAMLIELGLRRLGFKIT